MRGEYRLLGGIEGNIRLVRSHHLSRPPESSCDYGNPAAILEHEVTLRMEALPKGWWD